MFTYNSGIGIAASVASIAIMAAAASAVAQESADTKVVHCYGINSCKGTSDCKTVSNECKGQNVCKGHGFKAMTVKACKAAGGSLTEPK